VPVDTHVGKSQTRTIVLQKTVWERVCSISGENAY
jgi:hypothetical protein